MGYFYKEIKINIIYNKFMKNIKKIFISIVSIIYIFWASIWMHAYMMNNFSHDLSNPGCTHFNNHNMDDTDWYWDSNSSDNSWKHNQCLDSIYIWYKELSSLDLNILYKYTAVIFNYKIVTETLFENTENNNWPPIYNFSKYLKFSDLVGIIVLLN